MPKTTEEVLVHFLNYNLRKKTIEDAVTGEVYYALRADEIISNTMKPLAFKAAFFATGEGSTEEYEARVANYFAAGIADIGRDTYLKFWMSNSKFITDLKKRLANSKDDDPVVYVNFRDIGLDEFGAEKEKSNMLEQANIQLAKENADMQEVIKEMKAKMAGGAAVK